MSLQIQTNRGGLTECDKCGTEIEYKEDYFWNTTTGEIICENCVNICTKKKNKRKK